MDDDIVEMYFHANSCGMTDNDASKILGVNRINLWKLRKSGTSDMEVFSCA